MKPITCRIPLSIVHRPDLSPLDKIVYGMIGPHQYPSRERWPKLADLAAAAGQSAEDIQRSIARLGDVGLIT